MKTKRLRLMSILMAVAMVLAMIPMISQTVHADSEVTVGGVKYTLNDDNTATVTSYTSDLPADIVFQETVNGHTVTSIGNEAFDRYGGTLNSISIPKSVTSIGNNAFFGTGLASISIDENSELTYIGYNAFSNCSNLKMIMIPKTVTTIEGGAFSKTGLKTIIFEDGIELSAINLCTFEGCGNLESIAIPNSVTSIGRNAFDGCGKLKSITIPNSVTSIDWCAFGHCDLLNTVYYEGAEDQWNSMYRSAEWAGGREDNIKVLFSINAYDVTFDEQYLVVDDDPITPYVEQFYDVPADTTLNPTVAKGDAVLDQRCYEALYSEVSYNEAEHEYNIIDESDWQEEFPTNPGVFFCKVEGSDPFYGSFERIPLIRITTDITNDKVELSKASFVYNGKVQKPSVITVGGKSLKEGTDFTASWSNASSSNAGTYTVTIEGTGFYKGTAKATYTITKAANPLTIQARTATVKYKKLKKKDQALAVDKVISFTNKGQGKLTYAKASGNKKIKINKDTGKVTVKKKLKKGTYKVTVKVNAAGNANYNASEWKMVTFKIKVK